MEKPMGDLWTHENFSLAKKIFGDESAQTGVLKNILPLKSILSKFSELDLKGLGIKVSEQSFLFMKKC